MKPLSVVLALAAVLLHPVLSFGQSPGELVGYTQYDYQCNYSTGQRIAVDSLGGVHVAWMKGMPYPTTRHIYYSYRDLSGTWGYSDLGSGGYTQLAINSQNQPGVAFHTPTTRFRYWTPQLMDTIPGTGMWPYIAIDRLDRVHCIYGSGDMNFQLQYSRSDDGGVNWTAPDLIDTLTIQSYMITASRVSNKVAIIYIHPMLECLYPIGDMASFDVYYIESLDGRTWDWQNRKTNVSNHDTLRFAYAYDCDAVYDYNDNLHIVWNSQYAWGPDNRDTLFLYHYEVSSGTIREITHSRPDWPQTGCDFGHLNNRLTKISIAANTIYDYLAVVYTRFDSTDCSQGGYANGELYSQWLSDYYENWSLPFNLTNSHTPGCFPGDCESDNWPSMAEKFDDALHIFYVNDKDPGGVPQTEGSITDNPMLYLRHYFPIVGTGDNSHNPRDFSLLQNYPNPFNARTTIAFELKRESVVKFAIYDVTGALVETLTEGRLPVGRHTVTWDASAQASGIYFARLTAEKETSIRKMVLLK